MQFLKEEILQGGTRLELPVRVFGNEPLKATLVWTDPAGTPTEYSVDPPDPMLVNNLDLKITKSDDNTAFYPFNLDRLNPGAQATRGENNIDNVEQVVVDNPLVGDYTISISHKDVLLYGSQRFSLIISGASFDVNPPEQVEGGTIEQF